MMGAMRWSIALWLLAACGSGVSTPTTSRPPQNLAFATSTVYAGDFGGIAAGDAICEQLAHEAGLGGTWSAWLSDKATSAYSRIRDVPGGWVLLDGSPVARSASEVVTGSLLTPIMRDERGRDIRAGQVEVWTGTSPDGTPRETCNDWTTADPATAGTIGFDESGAGEFTLYIDRPCDSPRRIYCFETDRSAAVTIAPITGRLAFVTANSWQPNAGGVPAADALCQSEASAAGLSGTFLALMPLASATAASRFDTSGAPWTTPLGVPLSPTAAELFTGEYVGLWNWHADGSTDVSATTWGGDPINSANENGCSAWTSPVGTLPEVSCTMPWRTTRSSLVGGGCYCNDPTQHLRCMQP
jgi:hypothetical protein